MKFKKLLISASAIAASSGILATVLTSCAKANIDSKLRVDLDSEGKLYNPGKMEQKTFTWKDAITKALTRSSNWTQFKSALADEIVVSWYKDRAGDDKNSTFKTNIDEWKYQIDKDYNSTVQTCKNKYGANWEFYLQNEYLASNGGTEEAYKANKLVDKIKTDFVSRVFAKSYFGFRDGNESSVYPHTYTKSSKDVDPNTLRNPDNWDKIGFYATADLSFPATEIPEDITKVDTKFLAKNPQGDYAAIQSYVFDQWFKTEKPFFADAALFKYSMPTRVAGGKLEQIYNATYTGVKLPDKPNEAFPFFGAGDDASTRKAVDFLTDLAAYKFATPYYNGQTAVNSNGSITISVEDGDDSQTVLLVSGNKMFNDLYTPYAMACGSLYNQMLTTADIRDKAPNRLACADVTANIVDGWEKGTIDDFAMLSNFFYRTDPTVGTNPTFTKVLDLNDVYGGLTGDGTTEETAFEYHCPLFHECNTYSYFYGDTSATGTFQDSKGNYWSNKTGIRYITNNVQVNDFKYSDVSEDEGQPWIMEMNESGVHIQTIDCYNYVRKGTNEEEKLANLKKAVMYRLMQKQVNDSAAKCISADLLGENGKLKTYFNDNFANIIIALAQQKDGIFRSIDTYNKPTTELKEEGLFLNIIFSQEKLGNTYASFIDYLNAIMGYESSKKIFTNLDAVNSKIFSYRSKQITNSKSQESFSKTIFENGLLAPFVYMPISTIHSTRDYSTVNRVVVQDMDATELDKGFVTDLQELGKAIDSCAYVTELLTNVTVDGIYGFSPQIATAKTKMSNRFWYKSRIVDKTLHTLMGNKATSANHIKMNAYEYYVETKDAKNEWFGTNGKFAATAAANAFSTTYKRSKLLTGEKNLSNYVKDSSVVSDLATFYTTMDDQFNAFINKDTINNGDYSDENLNLKLFYATLMYLVGSEKEAEKAQDFDNFYTLLSSKVSDDEEAIVGYMARGYASGTGTLSEDAIQTITSADPYDYDFNADVDNEFDKIGYAGGSSTGSKDNSKLSSSSYWTAVKKTINGIDRTFNGFLGIQTKSSNQLDSGSKLQSTVFDTFAKATAGSYDLNQSSATKYDTNTGCWFKFGGELRNDLTEYLTWDDFTYDDGTEYKVCNADAWFPKDTDYAPVRKIAKNIIECSSYDDLRTIAKSLGSSYDGYSYFENIGSGGGGYKSIEQMKMAMLKLLPSKMADDHRATQGSGFEKAHYINTFKRVKNAEAHTDTVSPSVVFKDSKAKSSYKLMLTQINKADIVEHRLTPTWNSTSHQWENNAKSPITPEEFWVILFNLASESTVQQRVINEVVKNAFGDDKLIVYDAQLYNQFDSVWIKDWTKKTMGA